MIRARFAALITVVALNTAWASSVTTHGHGKGAVGSLLPECQAASALPSPHCGRTPASAFGPNGRLWVAFSQHGHIYVTSSSDLGKTFQPLVAVNSTPEAIYDDGENRPKIVFGKAGEIFVSWTHKTPGKYSGDVRFSRSLDGGKHFDRPVRINSDHAIISHRFDSMAIDNQGRIFLVWIDKRDKAEANRLGKEYAGASLYYAVSEDSGKSFKPNHKLVDHSCECCRIATDVGLDGKIGVLWRHVYPTNIRDHAIAKIGPDSPSISGMPTRATADDWQIDGCPHHGPDIALDGQQKAHIFWFSKGKKNRGLTYGRFNFANNKLELEKSIDTTASASRPQVAVLNDEIVLAWKHFNGNHTEVLVSRSSDHGESWSAPGPVAKTANASDHPQLVASGTEMYVAWHTQSEGYRLIPVGR